MLEIYFLSLGAILAVRYLWTDLVLFVRRTHLALNQDSAYKFPMFSHAYQVIAKGRGFLELACEESKAVKSSFISFWFGPIAAFITSDADDMATMSTHRALQGKSWFIYKSAEDLLGLGLVTINGHDWKVHRHFIQPTFHSEMLQKYVKIFNSEAAEMVKKLDNEIHKDIDILHVALGCTISTVMRTTLNFDKKNIVESGNMISVLTNCIERVLHVVAERHKRLWTLVPGLFELTSLFVEQSEVKRTVDNVWGQYLGIKAPQIAQNVREGKLIVGKKGGFVDLMLQRQALGQPTLTDNEIKDETITITGAGSDTSAVLLTMAMKMMAIYPYWQSVVHEEMDLIFKGDITRDITWSDLSKMEVLERVFKETLRFFPTVPLLARTATEDVVLSGKVVPKGSTIGMNLYALHHDSRYWKSPEEFDPDRFLPERLNGRHPYSYMPFSAGSRNCIGQRYAMLQNKVVLSAVLRKFRILPDAKYKKAGEISLMSDLTLRPKEVMRVKFEPRFGSGQHILTK